VSKAIFFEAGWQRNSRAGGEQSHQPRRRAAQADKCTPIVRNRPRRRVSPRLFAPKNAIDFSSRGACRRVGLPLPRSPEGVFPALPRVSQVATIVWLESDGLLGLAYSSIPSSHLWRPRAHTPQKSAAARNDPRNDRPRDDPGSPQGGAWVSWCRVFFYSKTAKAPREQRTRVSARWCMDRVSWHRVSGGRR